MKKLLILLLFPTIAHAQQPNPANIDSFSFTYTGIEKAPGASAALLHSRAKYFIYQYFNDPHQVIKYDDAEGGLFIAICNLPLRIKRPKDKDSTNFGILVVPMKLLFRNGVYKYSISEISQQGAPGQVYNGGYLNNPRSADRYMNKDDWQLARITSLNYIQAWIDEVNAVLQSDELDPDKGGF
jgi:hypothetical protein